MTGVDRAAGQVARLKNVSLIHEAMTHAVARPSGLPGIVVWSGHSGLGKTQSAIFVAHELRAYYVQMRSVWTRRSFLQAIVREMGMDPAGTNAALLDQVGYHLAMSRRPLIIDEADHALAGGKAPDQMPPILRVVHDIYESSGGGTLLLIGEEKLPGKLKVWEKVHNRVFLWPQARVVDREDGELLREFYCRRVRVADDLLDRILTVTHGVTRRVAVNLERVHEAAINGGRREVDLDWWGERPLFTSEPPAMRSMPR